MGKDKRGLGERSTNEAPIAPKLHKRLHRRRAVRSEYIEGKERVCVIFGSCDRCLHTSAGAVTAESDCYCVDSVVFDHDLNL